ncbi:MAG: hypothetical protein RIR18_2117, partial [Pseudomonadota bacterium]
HYALYGYFPALSYFDHPPLVGWSQFPFFHLFNNPPDWVLRIVPMACHAATLVLLARFTATYLGLKAGRWTALIITVAPLPHMLGAAQVPDSLLILWAAALLVSTQTLLNSQKVLQLRPWLALGLVLGLAGLSKYTAAFFVPSIVAVLFYAHGWRILRTPGPWLAMLLAATLVSPVIIWNAQHEWISFVYQGAHGTGNKSWQAGRVIQQLVLQLLVYGPLLTLFPLALLRQHQPRHCVSPIHVCLALAIPFLLIMFFLSGRSNALPHWTSPAWLLLAPIAGYAASQTQRNWKRWLLGFQGLLCIVLVGWMLSGGTPDPHGLKNPPADLYGWADAGKTARQLAQTHDLQHLAVQNWSIASRLAWYGRPLPVNVLDTRFDQFDLWYGDLPLGADALLVDWSPLPYFLPVGPGQFAGCDLLAEQAVTRWGKTLSYFQFYACRHWGGKPAPREKNG